MSRPISAGEATILSLADRGKDLGVEEVRELIKAFANFTRRHLMDAGYPEDRVRAILTKLRDAGRRSPPWRPASERVPGRPQDGADGNRRNRWLFDANHKFYADEINATLVEVKYYLQVLSMKNAPALAQGSFQESFVWLAGQSVIPGTYEDPIQKVVMDLLEFAENPRLVHSGHFVPLDKGGKHVPENAFLMYARSNQLQGNLDLGQLLDLMEQILTRHGRITKN